VQQRRRCAELLVVGAQRGRRFERHDARAVGRLDGRRHPVRGLAARTAQQRLLQLHPELLRNDRQPAARVLQERRALDGAHGVQQPVGVAAAGEEEEQALRVVHNVFAVAGRRRRSRRPAN